MYPCCAFIRVYGCGILGKNEEGMRVIIETPQPGEEEEIIVRASHLDARIMELLQRLREDGERLMGYHADGSMSRLSLSGIYYFEAVENKVFAYEAEEVSELKYRLYELEERLMGTDFIRISKSMILNLNKVERFVPSLGGRIEAVLKNGEKAVISRQYVPEVKKRLGII